MDKLKSVTTYIIIIFVVGIFATLISNFGEQLESNPNAQLSESSKIYIDEMTGGGKMAGLNTSVQGESVGLVTDLGGTDNKNEFSLDFSFGDKTGTKLQRIVYVAMNVPEFILKDVFRILTLQWLADLMDWFGRIMLFVAIGLWIRKGE